MKNEAVLRDVLNFRSWQHEKRSNSARPPSKMESWVQSWQLPTNVPCDLSIPSTQNHLSKHEDLMLQNATSLRKSARWPPNISDEHVSCTPPATGNASLQILFKCATPAIVFGNATKPSRFTHFWEGAQSLAPATRNDIWTSKSGANMRYFLHVHFEMCFAPQRRALFRHLNFQKVVRSWCALHILTSKCASRRTGVHFFNSSTSKSGPTMVCFHHFDFQTCFAQQRRALFPHLNFQKCSDVEIYLAFGLRNVLRATTACTFSSLIRPDRSAPTAPPL